MFVRPIFIVITLIVHSWFSLDKFFPLFYMQTRKTPFISCKDTNTSDLLPFSLRHGDK